MSAWQMLTTEGYGPQQLGISLASILRESYGQGLARQPITVRFPINASTCLKPAAQSMDTNSQGE